MNSNKVKIESYTPIIKNTLLQEPAEFLGSGC